MANAEHVSLLKHSIEYWNQWRERSPDIKPDLRGADLRGVYLTRANLCGAYLSGADLRGAYLSGVDLRQAYLSGGKLQRVNLTQAQLVAANFVKADLREAMLLGANLQGANLQGVNLHKAYLVKANLKSANLSWGHLQQANLTGADFSQAILCDANLTQANLLRTNLIRADLRQVCLTQAICEETQFIETKLGTSNFYKADATGANFYKADAIGVDFQHAILTGACIEDWNINSATNLDGIVCDHIYLRENHQERRPHGGSFQAGEFTQRFQKFLETVDLFFVEGVDWKAFLTSFQDLQSQYGEENLAVQGIERKGQSSFEIRLAIPPEADKAEIEKFAYERYEINLKQIEAQYEKQLRLQGAHLEDIQAILKDEREERTRLLKVVEKMAEGQKAPKYDMRGAQFAGGFSETVQGSQYGGTINNYGPNTEDITRLITALRDQAQTFLTDQQDEALDTLEALQDDLAKPEPDQGRIGRRLKKLVAIATLLTDLTDFTNNVIERTEKLGISIEQVQSPPSSNP